MRRALKALVNPRHLAASNTNGAQLWGKKVLLSSTPQGSRLSNWLGLLSTLSIRLRQHLVSLPLASGLKPPYCRSYASVGDVQDGPVAIDYSSLVPEREFHKLADEVLDHLQERIEEQGDQLSIEGFDTDYADGVLTVRLGKLGTYVLNKQTPNRQIWLSSPVSGPARFDWVEAEEAWIYRRTKAELLSFMERELSTVLKVRIPLTT